MSHLKKPTLLLPVRPLLVPCDYDPDSRGKVTWRRYTFGVNYGPFDTGQTILGRPVYFMREIERDKK